MIGGRKGHPGPKITRAEAVPAVRRKTSNKVPINTILFIFFHLLCSFNPKNQNFLFLSIRQTPLVFDVLIKLFIHDSFRFQEFKHDESS
jgi:hypothetical protein